MQEANGLSPSWNFAAPGPGGFGPPTPGGYAPPAQGGFGPPPGGGGYGPPGGGFGPGYYPPPPPLRQVHTMAIVSLVAGIVSWFLCPLLGGVVALICGQMARSAIAAEPTRWDGNPLAIAGMIVGGINVLIYVLIGVFYLLMLLGIFGMAALGA